MFNNSINQDVNKGQKVKFKFASKFEIDTDVASNMIHAKIKNLNFLQQEVRYKKIAEQISDELLQSIIIDDVCSDAIDAFWHEKIHIDDLSYGDNLPINVPIQDLMIGSCHYFTYDFRGNIHSTKMINTVNYPNIINDSL